jgi:diguanylate cyclase (GGDEF)-like protein
LGQEYDLEVDTNEKNQNTISIFVNFRVVGEGGELLGVIGVGFEVASIENVIDSYSDTYDLAIYIINIRGADNSFTGSTDVFVEKADLPDRTGITDGIALNMSEESNLQWFTSGGARKCLITKYDDTLGWYLVLEKDTASITRSFQRSIEGNIVFMLLSLAAWIFVTTGVVLIYNQRLIVAENTDELTGLPNRKLFVRLYHVLLKKNRSRKITMFMFDIDNFKEINDTHGHVFGNAVLTTVGEMLRNTLDGKGMAARWGGDEFLGVLTVDQEEAVRIMNGLMEQLRKVDKYPVTVSVGLSEVTEKANADQMIKAVDEALYRSKKTGRDKITVV